jgi:RNA polymerase sigma-54 factor
MKLSPRMIQAMEILQLPMLALQERIEQELSSNPCLEVKDIAPEATGAAAAEPGPSRGEETIVVKEDNSHQAEFQRLDEYGETFSEDLEWSGRAGRRVSGEGERDAKMDALANTPAHAETLADVLNEQWSFVDAPEAVKAAGRAIISNLDDDGYLRTPLEELVSPDEPLVTVPALQQALPMLQRLDPPGVAARDLRECLLIQLAAEEAAGQDVGLQKLLVNDFLHDIELNHIPQIARRTGKPVKEINEALAGLGRLDPRPGRMVGDRPTPYIIPDAIVELDERGNLVVTMREGDLPMLTLSRTYRKMADSCGTDDQAREFIRKNLRSAQWLMAAIMQRRQTVRRVVEEVFQAQKEFLERGSEALRPLPMTEVAAKVNVHVATVSRAVAGKYVQTPRGIFPLRMFFSGGTTTASGQDVAWDAVKARLKEVVEREDKAEPLDDDRIAEALQTLGITIARRTVAKYRGLLGIPPARQRRTF